MSEVYYRGAKAEAKRIAWRLAMMLTGKEPDAGGLARGVFLALGFAALSSIKDDFIVKSRGGAGADGEVWPPLSKEYLAYGRRFGRGEEAALKKDAGLGRANRFAPPDNKGLLTASQTKRWWTYYLGFRNRLLASMPMDEAKSAAAAMAWNKIKAEGGKTMLEVFGNRKVDMLRDTGVLLNSLSPGVLSGSGAVTAYAKPAGDGGDEQLFEPLKNGVIVGTTVKYAARQNRKRPFIPRRGVPQTWLDDWTEVGLAAVEVAARTLYGVVA